MKVLSDMIVHLNRTREQRGKRSKEGKRVARTRLPSSHEPALKPPPLHQLTMPLIKHSVLPRLAPRTSLLLLTTTTALPSQRHFSLTTPLSRPSPTPPLYPGHVKINLFERTLLATGSAFMSLYDTYRHGTSLAPLRVSSHSTPLTLQRKQTW